MRAQGCDCGREQAIAADATIEEERAFLEAIGWRLADPGTMTVERSVWRCPFCAHQLAVDVRLKPHDYECTPWNAPYGVQWTCGRCGYAVRQSLTVLADPERMRSTLAALIGSCPGTSAGRGLRR